MKLILLFLLSIMLTACGKAPSSADQTSSCPEKPTICGQYDHYGPECLTYDEYKNRGDDVSEATEICHRAEIRR